MIQKGVFISRGGPGKAGGGTIGEWPLVQADRELRICPFIIKTIHIGHTYLILQAGAACCTVNGEIWMETKELDVRMGQEGTGPVRMGQEEDKNRTGRNINRTGRTERGKEKDKKYHK